MGAVKWSDVRKKDPISRGDEESGTEFREFGLSSSIHQRRRKRSFGMDRKVQCAPSALRGNCLEKDADSRSSWWKKLEGFENSISTFNLSSNWALQSYLQAGK